MSALSQTYRTIATLLTLSVVGFAVSFPFFAQAAVNVVVNGGSGTNAERQIVTLNNQILSNIQMLVAKEYNLDPRASGAAKQAAVQYFNEMKNFLASGDAGNPFFIDNLELYKAGIRSKTVSNSINELQQSGICDAFKNEVVTQLKKQYILNNARSIAEKNTCAFDAVAGSEASDFLEGSYDPQHLWTAIKNPEDTLPIPVFLKNRRLTEEQADESEENAMLRAGYGDGFKDQYEAGKNVLVCTEGVAGTGDVMGIRDRCRIARPAEAIRLMAAGMQRVSDIVKTSADELQEDVIANTINQAIQQTVVTGFTGTAYNVTGPVQPPPPTPGPTPPTPGPGGLGDPLPNIPNDFKSSTTKSFLALVASNLGKATSTNPVREALTRTLTKLQYQIQTVKTVDDAEAAHEQAQAKYAQYSCYSLAFPNNFGNERTLTLTEAPNTIIAIKQLYLAMMMYEDALKAGTSTAEAIQLYQQIIQENFSIPNAIDLDDIVFKYNSFLNNSVKSFNTEFSKQVNACELLAP